MDYVVTGAWSKKAYEEASKFGLNVNLVAKGDNKSVPARDSWKLSPEAKYVHYCDNETIGGEWQGGLIGDLGGVGVGGWGTALIPRNSFSANIATCFTIIGGGSWGWPCLGGDRVG